MQHGTIRNDGKDARAQNGKGNVHERRRDNEPQIDDLVRKLSTEKRECEKGRRSSG